MQQVVSLCWSFIWSYNYYLQRTNLPLRGEIFCDIDYRPTAQLVNYGADWCQWQRSDLPILWSHQNELVERFILNELTCYKSGLEVIGYVHLKKKPRFTHFMESIIWVAISVENFPYSTLERFRWDFHHEALEISQITITIWITVSMAKSI